MQRKKKQDDRLYNYSTGVKFNLKFYFWFNLNKTLNCLATDLVSHCSHPSTKPTLSYTHMLVHTSTHTRVYQAAVCLKCCFYIAAIFHFGLLSLNCLWGFVWGEEPSHLYWRKRKRGWKLVYVLIHFLCPLLDLCMLPFSPSCFISIVLSFFHMFFSIARSSARHSPRLSPRLSPASHGTLALIAPTAHRWSGNDVQ